MSVVMAWSDPQLPWASSGSEDRRFQRILCASLSVLLALAIALPLLPVPALERKVREALPPQLAQIVLEKVELKKVELKKKAPPVPEPVAPKPPPEPVVEQPEPVVEPVPPRDAPPPAPSPPSRSDQAITQARQKAAVSGLLAFQDDLAQMRDQVDMNKLDSANLSRGQTSASRVERSLITSSSRRTSGGIDTAALSRTTGGQALSARETTRVRSDLAMAAPPSGRDDSPSAAPSHSQRSDEEIRSVMDRNKGGIFAIYNRALRKDPMLSGKMTVQLVIEPSGQVSLVKILASELGDPQLERKLLARIRMIAFGASSVSSTTLNYSFDFLPY